MLILKHGILEQTHKSLPTLKTGLISCWELDETSGPNAYDASINGYDGSIGSDVSLGYAGKINTAFYFKGNTNSTVIFPYQPFLTHAGSISSWFYYDGTNQPSMFNMSNSASSRSYFLFRVVMARYGVELTWRLNSGDENDYCFNSTLTGGNWYHAVVTNNGTLVKGYINGINVPIVMAGTGATNDGRWSADIANLDDCRLSGFYYTGLGGVTGLVDQTAVWDRELTPEDVSTLYNNGNGLSYSSWKKWS